MRKKVLLTMTLMTVSAMVSFGKNALPADTTFINSDKEQITLVTGDLNKDGISDQVKIVTPHDTANIEVRDFDGYEYNYNQPIMTISFDDGKGGFTPYKIYNNVIPHPENEAECVDVDVIITERGTLLIGYNLFYSMGGWSAIDASYTYRYQNDDFYLIGAEETETIRNTGKSTTVSNNYLTRKQQTLKLNAEGKKTNETWKKLPAKPLEKLGTRNLKGE